MEQLRWFKRVLDLSEGFCYSCSKQRSDLFVLCIQLRMFDSCEAIRLAQAANQMDDFGTDGKVSMTLYAKVLAVRVISYTA